MKLLSIDVGMKNLAYCIVDYNNDKYLIEKWDVINLCNSLETMFVTLTRKFKLFL